MESDTRSTDERAIDRRISAIRQRQSELNDLWNFACSGEAEYRMVEAEQKGLRKEMEELKSLKADLA